MQGVKFANLKHLRIIFKKNWKFFSFKNAKQKPTIKLKHNQTTESIIFIDHEHHATITPKPKNYKKFLLSSQHYHSIKTKKRQQSIKMPESCIKARKLCFSASYAVVCFPCYLCWCRRLTHLADCAAFSGPHARNRPCPRQSPDSSRFWVARQRLHPRMNPRTKSPPPDSFHPPSSMSHRVLRHQSPAAAADSGRGPPRKPWTPNWTSHLASFCFEMRRPQRASPAISPHNLSTKTKLLSNSINFAQLFRPLFSPFSSFFYSLRHKSLHSQKEKPPGCCDFPTNFPPRPEPPPPPLALPGGLSRPTWTATKATPSFSLSHCRSTPRRGKPFFAHFRRVSGVDSTCGYGRWSGRAFRARVEPPKGIRSGPNFGALEIRNFACDWLFWREKISASAAASGDKERGEKWNTERVAVRCRGGIICAMFFVYDCTQKNVNFKN